MTDNEIIKALETEIERLKGILDDYALQYGTVVDKKKVIDKANSEAVKEFAAKVIDMRDRVLINTVMDFAVREGITDLFLIDAEFVRAALFREMELRNLNGKYCIHCGSRLDKRGAE